MQIISIINRSLVPYLNTNGRSVNLYTYFFRLFFHISLLKNSFHNSFLRGSYTLVKTAGEQKRADHVETTGGISIIRTLDFSKQKSFPLDLLRSDFYLRLFEPNSVSLGVL